MSNDNNEPTRTVLYVPLKALRPDWSHMKRLKEEGTGVHAYVMDLLFHHKQEMIEHVEAIQIFNYRVKILFREDQGPKEGDSIATKNAYLRWYDDSKHYHIVHALGIPLDWNKDRVYDEFSKFGDVQTVGDKYFYYNNAPMRNGNREITFTHLSELPPDEFRTNKGNLIKLSQDKKSFLYKFFLPNHTTNCIPTSSHGAARSNTSMDSAPAEDPKSDSEDSSIHEETTHSDDLSKDILSPPPKDCWRTYEKMILVNNECFRKQALIIGPPAYQNYPESNVTFSQRRCFIETELYDILTVSNPNDISKLRQDITNFCNQNNLEIFQKRKITSNKTIRKRKKVVLN